MPEAEPLVEASPEEPAGRPEAPPTDHAAGAAEDPAAETEAPNFRVVSLVDVTVELPDPFAVVTLIEDEPPCRRLEIPVGVPDGTALAHALRRVETPRPLTHQLFVTVLARLQADLAAVRLVGRQRGTYLAELEISSPRGREIVSCRPSDGLALALRQPVNAPVLADERLLLSSADVDPA